MSLSAEEERALHDIERHLAADPQLLAWVNSANSAQAARRPWDPWDPWATAPYRLPRPVPAQEASAPETARSSSRRLRRWALGLSLAMLGVSVVLLMLGVLLDIAWLAVPAFVAPGIWVGVAWLVNRRTGRAT